FIKNKEIDDDDEYLSIDLNQAKEEQIDILVSKLAQFIDLNCLELISYYKCSKQMLYLEQIVQKIQKIKQLRIYLSFSCGYQKDAKSQVQVETCFRKFSNLTHLVIDASFSQIQPQSFKNMLSDLQQCDMLVSLQLNFRNQISLNELNMADLGILIGSFVNLQKLDVNLWDNKLSPQSFSHLAQGISKGGINLSDLTFNLENTKVNDAILSELGTAFEKCSNLKSLKIDLKFNNIKSVGLSQLIQSLSKCLYLSYLTLDFGWNKFGNLGADHLASHLKNIISLKYLHLSIMSCEIDSTGLIEIGKRLRDCSQLNSIKLYIIGNLFIMNDYIHLYNYVKHIPYLVSIY
ncbi:hypothetical protein ABPG74_019659, partial [Tetrahymena malaccensis]